MTNVLRGGVRPLAFLLREASGSRSRDNLTLALGEKVLPGQVCGIVTATGEVAPYDPTEDDGTQNAAVIPGYAYDATAAAVMGAYVTRDAELIEDALIWPAGISAPNKAAAILALKAQGLIVRPRSYVG